MDSWVKIAVQEYLDDRRRNPFRQWLRRLDTAARARIQARVLRFETGNVGDVKHLGDGIWEARLAFGPGYRIYFGRIGSELVLLLVGGDKGTQRRDIKQAKGYWLKYLTEKRHGTTK